MLPKMKKAVVRLKRLKMLTFAIKLNPEPNLKADTRIGERPIIEDIKFEILEDIHTEDYQVKGSSIESRSLVQRFLPKEESVDNTNASHLIVSSVQSDKEPHKVSNLKRSVNVWRLKHKTSSNKQYQCNRCGQRLYNQFSLRRHQKIHSRKRFECDQCDGSFLTEQHLRLHVIVKHEKTENRQGQQIAEKNRFKCDQCETDYSSSYALKEHQRLHNGKRVECDLCEANFATKRMLYYHKTKEHKNERYKSGDTIVISDDGSTKSEDESNKEWVRDDIINKDITESSVLDHSKASQRVSPTGELSTEDHQKTAYGIKISEKNMKCNHCDKCFRSKSLLYAHKCRMHSDKLYKCHNCGKLAELSVLKQLLLHKCDKCGKEYKCEQCGKIFTTLQHLKQHLLMHEDTSFPCDLCNKIFRWRQNMLLHRRVHTGKTFNCNDCGKRYTRNDSLQKHLKVCRVYIPVPVDKATSAINVFSQSTESGDDLIEVRPDIIINDEIVESSVEHNSNRRQRLSATVETGSSLPHVNDAIDGMNEKKLRQHSGSKKCYKCIQCGKNCTSLSHLQRHLLSYHSGTFPCDICNKKFRWKHNMVLHRRLHTGETFNCNECGKRYTRKDSLQKHLKVCRVPVDKASSRFQETAVVTDPSFNSSAATAINVFSQSTESGNDIIEVRPNLINNNENVKSSVKDNSKARQRLPATVETGSSLPHVNDAIDGMNAEKLGQQSNSKKYYKCIQCEKDLTSLSHLQRHLLSHHNTTFPCDICNKKFRWRQNMIVHRRVHTGETFNCNICDKRYTRNDALQKHLKVCRQYIPVPVDKASSKFQETTVVTDPSFNSSATADVISNDEIVESSVDNSQAGQRLSATNEHPTKETESNLSHTNHAVDDTSEEKLSQHRDSKRCYECNLCEKDFISLPHLQRHLLSHQTVIFPCDMCEKKFRWKHNMLLHRRLHTGETFDCKKCDKRFTRNDVLQKHSLKCREIAVIPDQSLHCSQTESSKYKTDLIQVISDDETSENSETETAKSEDDLMEIISDDENAGASVNMTFRRVN